MPHGKRSSSASPNSEDGNYDNQNPSMLSPTTSTSGNFSSAFSSPAKHANDAMQPPVASPNYTDTLDRKRHFTGSVHNLFKSMGITDDGVDGEADTQPPKATSESLQGPTSPQKMATSPGSRETLLATASAGVRKEHGHLPDMFDADLAALLRITEQT